MRRKAAVRIPRMGVATKCLLLFGLLLILSVGLQVVSTATKGTRIVLAATVIIGAITLIAFLAAMLRAKRSRFPAICLVVLLVGLGAFHFHGGHTTPTSLRNTYLARLRWYDGVHYVWGGETHFGIDCSGLVRTALFDAMLDRALIDGDMGLLRSAAGFWWRDMTAESMRKHLCGYTMTIGHAEKLADQTSIVMDSGYDLREGDIAVTYRSPHVMVYTGDGHWTEANPTDGRVLTNKSAGSKRPYFNMPVMILRWWLLDD